MKTLDVAPGWKTYATALLTALFNLLRLAGVVDLEPEMVEAINVLLGALIAIFLGLKIERRR